MKQGKIEYVRRSVSIHKNILKNYFKRSHSMFDSGIKEMEKLISEGERISDIKNGNSKDNAEISEVTK